MKYNSHLWLVETSYTATKYVAKAAAMNYNFHEID